jgi:hypothetical protein
VKEVLGPTTGEALRFQLWEGLFIAERR